MNFKNTIGGFKRLIGRQYKDADVQVRCLSFVSINSYQEELSQWGYRHQELPDGTVGVVVNFLGNDRVLSIVQVVAMYIVKLREFAELNLKTKVCLSSFLSDYFSVLDIARGFVDDVEFTFQVPSGVIGVPVWFNDAQRFAMLDACRVANFDCLKLFNETSAVALAYGIYKQDLPAEGETPRRVVFVDFGHSQLQMSACELVKGKLTVSRGLEFL